MERASERRRGKALSTPPSLEDLNSDTRSEVAIT